MLAFAGAPVAAEPPIESWVVPGVDLRITVPRDWKAVDASAAGSLMLGAPDGRGQIAVLSGPMPTGGSDEAPLGLEEAADASVESLRKSVRKFKLVSRNEIELASLPAIELAFRGRVGGVRFRWLQTLLVQEGHQIIVMYAAPEESYIDHLGDYDQILRSLRPSR